MSFNEVPSVETSSVPMPNNLFSVASCASRRTISFGKKVACVGKHGCSLSSTSFVLSKVVRVASLSLFNNVKLLVKLNNSWTLLRKADLHRLDSSLLLLAQDSPRFTLDGDFLILIVGEVDSVSLSCCDQLTLQLLNLGGELLKQGFL